MANEMVVPQAVVDRVNNELVRAILETPEYVEKIVRELLNEKSDRSTGYHTDPDRGKSLFERVLRSTLRELVEKSMINNIRVHYADAIDEAVKTEIAGQEKLDGSLAQAFARIIKDDYKVTVNSTFTISANN